MYRFGTDLTPSRFNTPLRNNRKDMGYQIGIDVGGTSFDVALVQDERAVVTSENEVGGCRGPGKLRGRHTARRHRPGLQHCPG